MKKQLLLWSMLIGIFTIARATDIVFPDDNFRLRLLENARYANEIDTDHDDQISIEEAEKTTSIHLACGIDFYDTTGIEYFKNITSLIITCGYSYTSIDLRECTKLEYCEFISSFELKNVQLPETDTLTEVSFYGNEVIEEVDVTMLPNLKTLVFRPGNSLKSIDLSQNTVLESLILNETSLMTIDVSNCNLNYLEAPHNALLESLILCNNPFEYIYSGENVEGSQSVIGQYTDPDTGEVTLIYEDYEEPTGIDNLTIHNCPNLNFIYIDEIHVADLEEKKIASPDSYSDYTVISSACNNEQSEPTCGIIDSNEESTLRTIYNTMGGYTWTDNKWDLNADVSEWSGVTIENCKVVGLELPNSNVTGSLPSEMEHLTNLKTLDLSGNSIGGFIPDEMGYLVNLEVLNLGNNNFTGEISNDLHGSSLKELYLNDNSLNGGLDSRLSSFSNLEILDLSNNNFSGSLPSELEYLKTVKVFNLSGNAFAGKLPSEIYDLRTLEELYLNDNNVSSNFQDEIGGLTELKILDVSNNSMSGELHNEMDRMVSLTTFNISNNNFTCSNIEPAYSFLSTIASFTYSPQQQALKCSFLCTDNFVSNIEESALRTIYNTMGGYTWTDNKWDLNADVSEWSGVTIENCKVVGLELPNSNVTGSLPSEMEHLTNLKTLDLSGNSIGGDIPDEIRYLVNLEVLNLSANALVGKLQSEIYELRTLEELYLNDNNISSNFQDEIGNLTELKILDVSNNNMSGELHNEMDRMVSLTTFNIKNNNFTCVDLGYAQPFLSTIDNYTYLPQAEGVNCFDTCEILTFTDINFKSALLDHTSPVVDTDGDGEISTCEAEAVTYLNVASKNISDLNEISYFVNLGELYANANNLIEINVSNNTALTVLYLVDNDLIQINVFNNTALTYLNLHKNEIAYIETFNNSALKTLVLSQNNLTHIDLFNNPRLTYLSVNNNDLFDIDLSENRNLISLHIGGNHLIDVNIYELFSLKRLTLGGNDFTHVDLYNNRELTYLSLYNLNLAGIDISNNTKLTDLRLQNNDLTHIDLTNQTSLVNLRISNNKLTTLDVSSCSLGLLQFYNNPNLETVYMTGQGQSIQDDLLFLGDCPTLEFICADEEYLDDIQLLLDAANQSDVTLSSDCDSNTEIEESVFSDYFTLSPNPATDYINLEVSQSALGNYGYLIEADFLIFDFYGNLIDFYSSYGSDSLRIELGHYETGTYFIMAITPQGEFTTQFIKL